MKRLPQFTGDIDGPFERVLSYLLLEHGASLQQLAADAAVFGMPGGSQVILLRPMPGLREALKDLRREGVEVMLVGGDRTLLEEVCPPFRGLGRILWAEGGGPEMDGWEGPLQQILRSPLPPPDWERFWKLLEVEDQKRFHRFRETQAFLATLQGGRVVATPALLVGVTAMWALEVYSGGPDFTPALVRMGAFAAERVREGEWWRLGSYAWLHGSWLHLATNGYVLWRLGGSLERMLGAHRLLLLYSLGAAAGGLASMGSDALSTGASGALWAIMAAEAALFLGKGGFVPPTIAERARGVVLQNIFMNVMISFLPQINWMAHLGGGLVGVALALSGALTRGLPRPGTDEPAVTPSWMKAAAGISTSLLVASGVAALLAGQPWSLRTPPTLVPQSLGPLTIPLPRGAQVVALGNGWQVGDPLVDPVVLYIAEQPLEEEVDNSELEALLRQVPEESESRGAPVTRTLRGTPVTVASYRTGDRVNLETALVVVPGSPSQLLRIDAVFLDEAPDTSGELPARIAAEATAVSASGR